MVSVEAAQALREPDDQLVERCRAGDTGAQRALYDRHVRSVMRTARRLGLTPEETEDVAQEVFAVAFREIGRVQPGALSSWLFRLVSNRVNDRHRRRRVRESFARVFGAATEPEVETGPGESLERKEAEKRVASILSRMTQKKRDVFVLFEIEEMTGDDVAARLGIPVDTVWTRLHHARKDFARIGRALAVIEDPTSGDAASDATRERVPVPFRVLVNPSYQAVGSARSAFAEGCLSVPGYAAVVARLRTVRLVGYDETGAALDETLVGWPARIVQHETDHLAGTLYLDTADLRTLAAVSGD